MTKRTVLRIFIFLVVTVMACEQATNSSHNGPYVVDPGIKLTVEKNLKSVNGITTASMDFRLFENDKVVADTYAKGKSIDGCITMSTLDGDTVNISGFMGMFAGVGYQIALFRDSCIVRHFAKSDAAIYKQHKNDSLQFEVSVPCKTYKLTLANKPTFKKGDAVEGMIELVSDEYYEVANGKERKYKVQLTGYFKTDTLTGTNK